MIAFLLVLILALAGPMLAVGALAGALVIAVAAIYARRGRRRGGIPPEGLSVLEALEGGGAGGGGGADSRWEGAFDLRSLGDEDGDGALRVGPELQDRLDDYGHRRPGVSDDELACLAGEYTGEPVGGDERMTRNALSRNDPVRPTIGLMRRRREMEQYFSEELDEAENSPWWGNYEY